MAYAHENEEHNKCTKARFPLTGQLNAAGHFHEYKPVKPSLIDLERKEHAPTHTFTNLCMMLESCMGARGGRGSDNLAAKSVLIWENTQRCVGNPHLPQQFHIVLKKVWTWGPNVSDSTKTSVLRTKTSFETHASPPPPPAPALRRLAWAMWG